MNDDLLLTWMTDSGGRTSIHLNVAGKTWAESYFGHLVQGDRGRWGYVTRTQAEPEWFSSYAKAHQALESAALAPINSRTK